ncbi:MlaC/ttg2D family ABC transporter substrate-binding protein [Desulfospira joergensenii]|uniref:MlaC/ttg2D family ABC transporter substrate-binding protein n=1 Tax=Desulfospira joergensenii TaxID=53329 RepID=UPI0003B702CD|nr:ABC transporter substrate-binding protein [Desulfospira joergensenii]
MNFIKKFFLILIFAALLFPWAVQASPARDQLKLSIDAILDILRNDPLKEEGNFQKRRDLLRRAIHARFDFEKISQLSLARHWKGLSDQEKQRFVQLFSQLLETTYITKIESYTNEKVVYGKDRVKKKKAQVNTKIVTDTVEIPINYRMYTRDDSQWMIYDMVIEGVSLVANYRSQFGQILEKGSFENLVELLEKKITDKES